MAGGSSKKSPKRKSYIASHPKGVKSPSSSSRNVNEDMSTGVVDRASPKDEHRIESCTDNEISPSASPKHSTLFSMQRQLDSLEKQRVTDIADLNEAHRRELEKLNEAHSLEKADLSARLQQAEQNLTTAAKISSDSQTNASPSAPLPNSNLDTSSHENPQNSEQLREVEAQFAEERDASQTLQAECKRLREALSAAESRADDLTNQLHKVQVDDGLRAQLATLTNERATLTAELEDLGQAFVCLHVETNAHLESVPRTDIRGKLRVLLTHYEESRQKNLELTDHVAELSERTSTILRDKDELEKTKNQLQADLRESINKYDSLLQTMDIVTTESIAEKQSLRGELQQLQDEAKKNLAVLTKELESKDETHRNEMESARKCAAEDTAALQDLIQSLKNNQDETQSTLASVREELRAEQGKLAIRDKELACQRESNKELEDKLSKLSAELESEHKSNGELEDKLSKLNADVASERKGSGEVEVKLNELSTELASERKRNEELEEKLSKLSAELASERKGNGELEETLSKLNAEVASERKSNEELREKLSKLSAEVASERKSNEELGEKLEQLSAELLSDRSKKEELIAEVEKLNKELASGPKQSEVEEQLRKLMEELASERRAKDELEEKLRESQKGYNTIANKFALEQQKLEERIQTAENKQTEYREAHRREETRVQELEEKLLEVENGFKEKLLQEENRCERFREELSKLRSEKDLSLTKASEKCRELLELCAAKEAKISEIEQAKQTLEIELAKVMDLSKNLHPRSGEGISHDLSNCSDFVKRAMEALQFEIRSLQKSVADVEEQKRAADTSHVEHQKEMERLMNEFQSISTEHERLKSGAQSLADLLEDSKDANNLSMLDIGELLVQFEQIKDELESSRVRYIDLTETYEKRIRSLEDDKSKSRADLEAARKRVVELESAEKHRQDQESKEVKEVRERCEKTQINLRKLNEELENNRETCRILKAAVAEWQTKKQDADLVQKSTQMALVRQEEELEQVKRSCNAKSEEIKALQSELEEYRTQLEERKTRGLLRRLWNAE